MIYQRRARYEKRTHQERVWDINDLGYGKEQRCLDCVLQWLWRRLQLSAINQERHGVFHLLVGGQDSVKCFRLLNHKESTSLIIFIEKALKSKSISFFRRMFYVVSFRPMNFFNKAVVSFRRFLEKFKEQIICTALDKHWLIGKEGWSISVAWSRFQSSISLDSGNAENDIYKRL